MSLPSGTATFTNGSTAVTGISLTRGNLGKFGPGTKMIVGENPVTAQVEGLAVVSQTEITLRDPWGFTTGSYPFAASMTTEAVWDAAQTMRTLIDTIGTPSESATASTVAKRKSNATLEAAAGVSGNDVLTWQNLTASDTATSGVMKAGDAGWLVQGGAGVSPIAADFNLATVSGSYFINGTTSNGPRGITTERGSLLVQVESNAGGNFFGSQTFISRSAVNPQKWFRSIDNGVFGTWRELYHTGNLIHAQNTSGSTVASNGTVAGSGLTPAQSGTWRNVSGGDILNNGYGLWQIV